jgi:sRNA-binding carbon storage regulator CsrA
MDANNKSEKPKEGWLCLTIEIGESVAIGDDILIHYPVNNRSKRARIAIRAKGKRVQRYRVKRNPKESAH